MVFNDNSKIICSECRNLLPEEYARYHIPIDNPNVKNLVVNANGSVFYVKSLGNYRMINELIGSFLAKKLDLDTVDYEIGKTTAGIQALSHPFYEEGYYYKFFRDYYHSLKYPKRSFLEKISSFHSYCATEGLDMLVGTALYESALKLIAIDLKMSQIDRHGNNIQVKIKDDEVVSLAPIYDYSESYVIGAAATFYRSPLVWVRKNRVSLEELIKRHPELWNYLEYLMSFSIYDILQSIGDEKNIDFTGDEIFNYVKSQKLIERPFRKIKLK